MENLLFGLSPRTVFLPGLFVMGRLQALGFAPKNPVGVVSTVVFWWALILFAWSVVHNLRGGRSAAGPG